MKWLAGLLVAGIVGVLGFVAAIPSSSPRASLPAPPPKRHASPVRAATSFLEGLTAERLLDPVKRERWLARHVVADSLEGVRRQYAAEARSVAVGYAGTPRLTRSSFLGYRVSTQASSAHVSLWAVTLGGSGDAPVAVGWRTFDLTLEHEVDGWMIAAVDATPGPSPQATAAELRAATARFRSFDATP